MNLFIILIPKAHNYSFQILLNKQEFIDLFPQSTTILRNNYYRAMFSICDESRIKNGFVAGRNFWGFGGTERLAKNSNYWWSEDDDYVADPPPKEQGLNTVFDQDKSTWNVIQSFKERIHQ